MNPNIFITSDGRNVKINNIHQRNPSSKSSSFSLKVFCALDLIDIFYLANLSIFLNQASIIYFFILNLFNSSLSKLFAIFSFYSIFIERLPYYLRSYQNIYRGLSLYFNYFWMQVAYYFSAWAFDPLRTLIFYIERVIVFLLFLKNQLIIVNFTVLYIYSTLGATEN